MPVLSITLFSLADKRCEPGLSEFNRALAVPRPDIPGLTGAEAKTFPESMKSTVPPAEATDGVSTWTVAWIPRSCPRTNVEPSAGFVIAMLELAGFTCRVTGSLMDDPKVESPE